MHKKNFKILLITFFIFSLLLPKSMDSLAYGNNEKLMGSPKFSSSQISVKGTNNLTIKPSTLFSTGLQTLGQVQKPTWNGDIVQWTEVPNSVQYEVKLYRDTTLVNTQRVDGSIQQVNLLPQMTIPGEYSASIQAIGDNTNYSNGEVSIPTDKNRKGLIYFEDFESNNGGFTVTGSNPSWQWGLYGISNRSSKIWYTRYNNNENSYVVSPNINLSNITTSITLNLMLYARTEPEFDFIHIEISKNGGQTWDRIYTADGYITVNTDWRELEFNIDTSYAVPNFKVRFGLETDDSITDYGFSIDDIKLTVHPSLSQVQKPTWNGDVVQWNEVDYSNGYILKLYRDAILEKTIGTLDSEQEYDLAPYMTNIGVYTVTVQAKSNNTNIRDGATSLLSDENQKTIPSLNTVQKPIWNGDVLQWNGVANANLYEINLYRGSTLVNTQRVNASVQQFDFTSLMTVPGRYYAIVRGIGDNINFRDGLFSPPSDEHRILNPLDQVQKPTWNNDVIQWNGVANASQYEVKLFNGTTLIKTQRVGANSSQLNYFAQMTDSGLYTVTVQAIGDNINYKDGETSIPSDGNRKNILYYEDFENNNGDYSIMGTNPSWKWGNLNPYTSPFTAFSGSNVWATNLNDQYYNNENSFIISPNIDLSKAVSPIKLSWMQFADFEISYDYIYVEISKDGGQNWNRIYFNKTTTNSTWKKQEFTIDPSYATTNFKIRFGLITDYVGNYKGFYIDDVMVSGNPIPTLAQVEKPTWSSDVIQWNSVENALQYEIKLFNGTTLVNTRRVEASVQTYNFTSFMTNPGNYTVTVQAIGDALNYLDGPVSFSSDEVKKTVNLAQVQKPFWNGDIIQWQAIENASQFEIKLYNKRTLVSTLQVSGSIHEYNFESQITTPGEYTVTIQAIGDNNFYKNGSVSQRSNKKITLNSIKKPIWKGSVIWWTGVPNASQYEVKLFSGTSLIATEHVEASERHFNFALQMIIPSEYTVSVQAISDSDTYRNGPVSLLSDQITTLNKVQKPTWNGENLEWTEVENALHYEVKLYRGTTLIKTQRVGSNVQHFNFANQMRSPGEYTATVQAIGDGKYYWHGPVSEPSGKRVEFQQ
ncbi:hypothetical protein [Bacillus sp. T3]|uniref:hypothetical protein n=1 Tax=Bacillus sp. T3 TaxID=467262 RepID=UPI0029817626|nr:hypothetical protein [Bacillus sp. T3]